MTVTPPRLRVAVPAGSEECSGGQGPARSEPLGGRGWGHGKAEGVALGMCVGRGAGGCRGRKPGAPRPAAAAPTHLLLSGS